MVKNQSTISFMYCTTHDCGVLCAGLPDYALKCEGGNSNCVVVHTGTICYDDVDLHVNNDVLLTYNDKFHGGFHFHMFATTDLSGLISAADNDLFRRVWFPRLVRELEHCKTGWIIAPHHYVK